jgi:predicted small metal-binding protein
MKDCNFEVKGSPSKEEVLQIAAVHAKQSHKIDPIPAELGQRVNSAIKS